MRDECVNVYEKVLVILIIRHVDDNKNDDMLN